MAETRKTAPDTWEVFLASKERCEITVTVGMTREDAQRIIREEKARGRDDEGTLGSAILSRLM